MTRRTARGEQGRISVGYTNGAAFHPLMPRIIFTFKESFPLVSLTLVEGVPDELIQRMQNGQIDTALMRTSVTDMEGITAEPLLRETVVAALSSGHPLARLAGGRDSRIPLKALANETFILVGRPHTASLPQSNAEIAACQAAGFTPRIGHLVSSNISRLALVAAGQGVALMSESMQRVNIEGVVFRRLRGAAQLRMPLLLASRRGDASAVIGQFLKLARRTGRTFGVNQDA